jgi:hypothetical protein
VDVDVDPELYHVHVRGIGVDGWDGTPDGVGTYENSAALREIFSRFGDFKQATIRHRVVGDQNTSWALVTMGDAAAVDKALAAHSKSPILAGSNPLVLTRFNAEQAAQSKGAMSHVRVESLETREWRVDPAYKPMILTCSGAEGTETLMFGEEALDFKTEGDAGAITRTFTAIAATDGHLILINASEVEKIHNHYPTAGLKRTVKHYHQTTLRLMKRDNEMAIDSDDTNVVCDMMEPHIVRYLHEVQGTKETAEVHRPQEALLLEIEARAADAKHRKRIGGAVNATVTYGDEQEDRLKQLEDAQGRIEAGESSRHYCTVAVRAPCCRCCHVSSAATNFPC